MIVSRISRKNYCIFILFIMSSISLILFLF